jgi:hypothetical protein
VVEIAARAPLPRRDERLVRAPVQPDERPPAPSGSQYRSSA